MIFWPCCLRAHEQPIDLNWVSITFVSTACVGINNYYRCQWETMCSFNQKEKCHVNFSRQTTFTNYVTVNLIEHKMLHWILSVYQSVCKLSRKLNRKGRAARWKKREENYWVVPPHSTPLQQHVFHSLAPILIYVGTLFSGYTFNTIQS